MLTVMAEVCGVELLDRLNSLAEPEADATPTDYAARTSRAHPRVEAIFEKLRVDWTSKWVFGAENGYISIRCRQTQVSRHTRILDFRSILVCFFTDPLACEIHELRTSAYLAICCTPLDTSRPYGVNSNISSISTTRQALDRPNAPDLDTALIWPFRKRVALLVDLAIPHIKDEDDRQGLEELAGDVKRLQSLRDLIVHGSVRGSATERHGTITYEFRRIRWIGLSVFSKAGSSLFPKWSL